MKKKFLTAIIGILLGHFSFGTDFTDSVKVGLPGLSGVRNFTLKLRSTGPSSTVYQSLLFLAVPKEKSTDFERRIVGGEFDNISPGINTAVILVKSDLDSSFGALSSPAVFKDSIQAGLARLGSRSGHAEMVNSPLVSMGFAGASRFALALAYAIPEKSVAILSIRAYRLDAISGGPSIGRIPHLVLTGEVSGPDVRGNNPVYFSSQLRSQVLNRRASGELVQQAVEFNASQSTFKKKTLDYVRAFIQDALVKRLPPGSNPLAGPVTLTLLTESAGYLGSSTSYNNFKPEAYRTAAFGGQLAAPSSFWFTGMEMANTWKSFHKSAFDSSSISPLPLPAVPYCSGQRPSSIEARFLIQPGVVFGPGNFFRIEVSDITGNFDHPVYAARWFGTTSSTSLSDSILGAIISDNLSYMPKYPNATKRYRLRLISTDPYYESPNFGEMDINFCGPAGGEPRVYLSTLRPYKSTYNPGDSIAVMVYKNPIFPYTPGNTLRIELSGKNYDFTPGVTTVMFSGVPPFNEAATRDSFLVKMKLPDTLSFGNRYRLKPFIEGVSAAVGRQTSGNGHDITLVPNQSGTNIVISTSSVTNITQNSASTGGNILFAGGSPITARGVCWSTNPGPTTALSTKTVDGTGIGVFTSTITGLMSGTVYYVRAYASNANGTVYGNELSFSTAQPDQAPVVSTDSVISITQTEAISGGNVTFDGNSDVTSRGVCWSTTPNPTFDLVTKTEDGTGTGTFISNLTGLNPNTTYFVRAYGVNSTGVGYGNQRTFTTSGNSVQVPSVLTNNVTGISFDSARCGGNVTFDGGGAITARGVCWSTDPSPTVALPTKTVDGSGPGQFISRIGNLSPSTSYFLRAYATNSAGTGYGDEVTFTTVVSVRESLGSSGFSYFPNPADDALFLKSVFPVTVDQIEVIDANGRILDVPKHRINTSEIRINTSALAPGLYQLRLKGQYDGFRFPFVK